MATTNLGLVKPNYSDAADVDAMNDNMDKIDAFAGSTNTAIAGKMAKPTNTGSSGQILRNNGMGGAEWDNAATQQEIGEAVTDWLDANVPTGTTVVVDNSLSISGAAADAKKTGDELSDLKSAMSDNELNTMELADIVGTHYKYERTKAHGQNVGASDGSAIFVDIKSGNIAKLLLSDPSNSGTVLAFYAKYKGNTTYTNIGTITIGTQATIVAANDIVAFAFYKASGLTEGTFTLSVEAYNSTQNTILKKIEKNETDIEKNETDIKNNNANDIANIASIAQDTGTHYIYTKDVPHGTSVGASDTYAIIIDVKELSEVKLLISDANNAGAVFNFYVKGKSNGSYVNIGTITEGVEKEFVSDRDASGYALYKEGLVAGTLKYSIDVYNPNNVFVEINDKIDNINNWTKEYTWHVLSGASARGYVLRFPTIKRGTPLFVTVTDANGVLDPLFTAFYYIKAGQTGTTRDGYIRTNRRTQYIYNEDINGVQIYSGGAATGDITIKVESFTEKGFAIASETEDIRLSLPSYYFVDDYLPNKVSRIKTLIDNCAANGDIFFFITDTHWEWNQQYSAGLIKYIADNVNIPRLFHGGDTYNIGIRHEFGDVFRKGYCGKIYYTVGNHEYLEFTSENKIAAEYYMDNDDIVYGNSERHYYYVNNNQKKIRYIILNSYAPAEGQVDAATPGYEQEQLTWFENVALNVENGWTIIIFTHSEYNPPTLIAPYEAIASEAVKSIVQNYSGNGTIAAMLSGHAHVDGSTMFGSVPVVVTTCDKNQVWKDSNNKPDICQDRSSGTINEQAFDVVILDKTNRKLTFVRIGAKVKKAYNEEVFYEEREFNY